MKKSFTITAALCFLLLTNCIAGKFNTPLLPHNKVKDTVIVEKRTNRELLNDSSYFVHSIDYRTQVMFGIKGGINLCNVYNGPTETRALPLTGWVAGTFVTIPINKFFGFQPELLIAEKGFKTLGTVDGNSYYFRRKTIYIDMPLLLQFKPTKSLSLLAGPLLSFLFSTKDTYDMGNITNEQKDVIANGVIHKNVLGAEVGMDIYIQKILVSFRGGWDLQDLNDGATSNSRRYQNSWVQATIGYMF